MWVVCACSHTRGGRYLYLIFHPTPTVGVPSMFLLVLYHFEVPRLARSKVKMHQLKAVLVQIGLFETVSARFESWDFKTEPINLLSSLECKAVLEHEFQNLDKFDSDVLDALLDAPETFSDGSKDDKDVKRTASQDSQQHKIVCVEDVPVDVLRRQAAERIASLCWHEVVAVPPVTWNGETGASEKLAISRAGFLFTMYRVQCW
jgi:hypothetical protein